MTDRLIKCENKEQEEVLDMIDLAADQGIENVTLFQHQLDWVKSVLPVRNGGLPGFTLTEHGKPWYTFPAVNFSVYRNGRSYPLLKLARGPSRES